MRYTVHMESMEADLPKEEFDIFEVSAWEAGHHEPTNKIVVVFRYNDREPIAFGCDPVIAEELGKGLLALAAEARMRKH